MNEQQIRDWSAIMVKLENARKRADQAQRDVQLALGYITDCQELLQRLVPDKKHSSR